MTLAIGLMSGTSVDGVDAVLMEVSDDGQAKVLDTLSRPMPDSIRERILSLMAPGDNEIERSGRLHVALGELYAQVANEISARDPASNAGAPVAVIGCHGQTVRHHPDTTEPFTLQLGSGAVIAARTGIATVTDFRSADIAHGGQGAPFAPFFHHHVFSAAGTCRAIVNLGGIANITILPGREGETVTGFDCGPANGLMDLWIQRHLNRPYDDQGRWASQGEVNADLLEAMLEEPYFSAPAPKSTGRELFNENWLDRVLSGSMLPLMVCIWPAPVP